MRATADATDARPDDQTVPVPRVLAVVVTHNGRPWLTECLVGLNSQTYPFLDILLVDDATPYERGKPSLKRVAKRHLQRRRWGFLRTPRPLGFGGAINWALSRVRTDADLLLFIHDDAALDPGSVERMIARVLDDPRTAIVGPKIVSWTDPTRLEEVGMAADRFGYPYKGLEEGEIDLGQHDAPAEVFYVTSTCMLMRSDVFRQLRGWDARMRAFAEDLDLCWRARVAGYAVRVEPRARVRHAIALARGERRSRFTPIRYFIRRNRLRTVTKNASGVRLLALLPQFVLLAFAEMLGFIVLRQPGEIANLFKALGWNFMTFPQTLSERARVQRSRRVPDRRFRSLTVGQTTRVRVYVAQKADQLEQTWGRRAELLAERGREARASALRLRGWVGAALFLGAIALALALRGFLWAPQASVGELLPYPDHVTAVLRAFLSPWQSQGLGYPGAGPPAFALLGAFPLITLGAAGAAQKLLVLTLGVIAFYGGYKLMSEVADRPGRVAAAVAYALGNVGYAGMRSGDLGALVFGAAAPFVLHSLLRLTGWMRPPAWNRGRAVARVALGSAVSAAFVPGSLILYALCAAILAVGNAFLSGPTHMLRRFSSCIVGLALGWILLLPWSASWWGSQGVFGKLFGHGSNVYAANFHGHNMGSVLLGQTPRGPALLGVAMPLFALAAILVGERQRRKTAIALLAVIVTVGLVVAAIAAGIVPPFIATPDQAGVLAAVAFAGLVGLGVAAFRLDLPRRGLGTIHAVTIGLLAAGAFLIAAGSVPAIWHGDWTPGKGTGKATSESIAQVDSVISADIPQFGAFRALWVGPEWSAPNVDPARSDSGVLVTGPRGQEMTDLFDTSTSRSRSFQRAIESIESGATDRAGGLLGAFNIRYVVVARTSGAYRWLGQRDLGLVRTEHKYLLLENQNVLARAAVYNHLPPYVQVIAHDDPSLASDASNVQRGRAAQRAAWSYRLNSANGPGVVFLAESFDPGWRAKLQGASLGRIDGGWGNAFVIPKGLKGTLDISFPRTIFDVLWLLMIALAWVVVLGASFSKRREPRPAGVPT